MTVSGVTSYSPAFTFIAKQALFNAGAIGDEEDPTGEMYAKALFQANVLLKQWQAMGIHVWTEEEAILFLQLGQKAYDFGSGATDHCCDARSYVAPQLTASASAGTHTVTVSSITGITSGDHFGIVLDSGATQWTTVNGAPSGTTVTLTDALASSAQSGNLCFDYTTNIVRPLLVPTCRRLQWAPGTTQGYTLTPLTVLARQQYMDLPNPEQTGTPNQIFYTPQRDTGTMYVWQPPNSPLWALRFTWYRPLETYLDPTTTSDFPDEWSNALIWNIAEQLAPGYGVDQATMQRVAALAASHLEMVQSWDRESEPIQFGMNWWGRE